MNLSKKRNRTHAKVSQPLQFHAFNPSTREVETGVIWLGRERCIRWKETGVREQSEVWWRHLQFKDESRRVRGHDCPFDLRVGQDKMPL